MRPNFTKMQISDLSTFESHFQDMLTALPAVNKLSNLIEVDLQPLFFRMTLDSASELLLGRTMAFRSQLDLPGSASLRFLEAFDYAQKKIHKRDALDRGFMKPFGLAYRLLKGTGKDQFEEACDTVHSVMDEIIGDFLRSHYQKSFKEDQSKSDESKKYVFLDAMAETTLDPLELRYEVLNVLVAGRDTTATLLSNAFFMLARHPDIWSRLQAEVNETFEGRLPDYATLNDMKQVRYLLNECKYNLQPSSPSSSFFEANMHPQVFDYSLQCHSICALPHPTPRYREEGALMGTIRSSSKTASKWIITHTLFTAQRKTLVQTPRISVPSVGRTRLYAQDGHIFRK